MLEPSTQGFCGYPITPTSVPPIAVVLKTIKQGQFCEEAQCQYHNLRVCTHFVCVCALAFLWERWIPCFMQWAKHSNRRRAHNNYIIIVEAMRIQPVFRMFCIKVFYHLSLIMSVRLWKATASNPKWWDMETTILAKQHFSTEEYVCKTYYSSIALLTPLSTNKQNLSLEVKEVCVDKTPG